MIRAVWRRLRRTCFTHLLVEVLQIDGLIGRKLAARRGVVALRGCGRGGRSDGSGHEHAQRAVSRDCGAGEMDSKEWQAHTCFAQDKAQCKRGRCESRALPPRLYCTFFSRLLAGLASRSLTISQWTVVRAVGDRAERCATALSSSLSPRCRVHLLQHS